jgi:hypothetical protein
MRISRSSTIYNFEFDSVYVDFDDTVIVNGSLNVDVISFLVHQRNRGKAIILITKHDGDLEESLLLYKLSAFFDRIIHISKEKNKANFVEKSGQHLFIDDSFSELWNMRNTPNVECLHPSALSGDSYFLPKTEEGNFQDAVEKGFQS